VWFDQSELRGGDAWDRQIRERIHDCRLFIALISAHTEARDEGYFRHEWKLAVERTHHMSDKKPFLVPVVIDDTRERGASVPDKLHEVQWTRLPGGETPPEFAERVRRLVSPELHNPPTATVLSAVSAPAPPQAMREAVPASQQSKWALPAIAAAVVAGAVVYLAIDRFWISKHPTLQPTASAAQANAAPTAFSPPPHSIAVLPFVNMSGDKEQEYFADGLAEELLDLLAKTPDLHVIARTSSFSFKGKSDDIPTIAAKLRVANILEGSVRKSGNRLRISAQLIRTDTSEHLWSETFERDLNDVFKVQDEIAAAVAAALKIHLLPTQQHSLRSEPRTGNLEAYDLYLQGKESFNHGDAAGYQRAVAAFRGATELDSKYAAAYAALALAEFWNEDSNPNATNAGYDRALAAAEKAVALAPDQAAGYAARGFLRTSYRFDFAGAQSDLAKAVALNPGDADVLHRSAIMLATLGDLPAAIEREQKALALDPLSAEICMRLAFFYVAAGRFAEARPLYERALTIAPNSIRALYNLGDLELFENRPEAALAAFRQNESDAFRLQGQARAEYSLGHAEASQRLLQEYIAEHRNDDPYAIARVYAWRGETDKAFEWLERALVIRQTSMAWLKIDPIFRSMHNDARYKHLLREMHLPE
jgi:TolB-like protein/thioredoxin-like negative regulator of GroEL